MCKRFDEAPLGQLFEITKGSICPFLFPNEEFVHHSLPAFDAVGGPAIEFGKYIESNKTLLSEAVVLLSKLNPRTSRVSIADPTSSQLQHCCSTEFIAYKPKQKSVRIEFYKYFFQTGPFRVRLQNVAIGTTNSHVRISPSETLNWNIPKPTPEEQTKIAEVLSTVDRAIEQTEALIAKQQRIKTGLMQDLLTRGIDEHGNLHSEETHQFWDSPLGRVPKDWCVQPLGAALHKAKGFLQTGPFGSQLHAYEYVHEGIPVIMPQNIFAGRVSEAMIARVPERRAEDLRRHRVQFNDVIFSRRGDLSRAVAIGEREIGWLCGTGCFLLRVSSDAMDARWLADVYRHHHIQRQVDTNAVGSTMPSLNNAVMEQLTMAFPSVEEQREITRRRDAMDGAICAMGNHLLKLCSLKTALMQDLLTGKVRVTTLLTERQEAGE